MFYKLTIVSFFLSDFGFKIAGQGILLCQCLSLVVFFERLYRSMSVNIEMLVRLSIIFLSLVWSIFYNFGKEFAGQNALWNPILSAFSVILFFIMVDALYRSIHKYNGQLHLFLLLMHVIYFVLEYLSFYNFYDFKPILQLLHIHDRALEKYSLSLFGKEHSYGSMGPIILICFSIILVENNKISKTMYIINIIIYCIIIITLTSKTALIVTSAILLMYHVDFKHLNFSKFVMFFVGLISFFFVINRLSLYTSDILLLQGASSFLRFYFAYAGVLMFLEVPFTGVGLGGYRFNFVDTVVEYGIPLRYDIVAIIDPAFRGGVDPTNFVIGIFSEFGFILGLGISYLLLKYYLKYFRLAPKLCFTFLFAFITSCFGFYYWGQPFMALFIILPIYIQMQQSRV